MNFEQFSLDRRIAAAIKTVGYTTLTPIQQQAILIALKGCDVLGLAQTGTGKTVAFLLPILHQLTQGPLHQVRDIENVLDTPIERRRLPDFDYGDFEPESYSQRRRSSRPWQTQSHRQHGSKPSAQSGRKPAQSRSNRKKT